MPAAYHLINKSERPHNFLPRYRCQSTLKGLDSQPFIVIPIFSSQNDLFDSLHIADLL